MWEIVSFGDVITLNQIFNAISVIFSDAGYKAASVAILLFVTIGMTIHNFIGGAKELPFGQILAGILLFGMGFTTLTSVSIENRYDGTVTQIDNVPIAIAVPASLVSSVGLWITTKTETAFANTGMQKITTDGYLSPLKVIANLRRATYSDSCPSGLANSTGVYNLCYSLRSYMADCAMIKSTRDNHSLQMQKGDILTEMQFNSNAYSTQLVKADGTTEDISCSSAYTKIKNDLNTQQVNMMNALGGHIGLRTGEDGIDRVKQALKAIAADSSKATNFSHSIYLANPSEWGTVDYLQKIGASDLAENYTSSIQQRNYEWALQAEMWVKIVDKFLSLFEAILYAVAPFIGLMVLTGSVGMKTLLLYVQMLLVIQFIPPMLVIVQNITLSDMAVYQKTLIGQGMVVGSLDYMQALTKKANELMGLGGMLATSVVPAMAMALVSGSGMAMMGAIRSAAAPPKDTDAAPQIADQGGVTNLGKMSNGDMNRHGDIWSADANSAVIDIANQTELQSSVSEKQANAITKEQAWQAARSTALQSINKQSSTIDDVATLGRGVTSSTADGKEWSKQTTNSLDNTHGFTTSGASTVAGAIGLAGRIGTPELISVFQVGANGEIKESFMETLNEQDQEALKKLIQTGEADKLVKSFRDDVMANNSNTTSILTGDDYIDADISKTDIAHKEAESAKQEYSTSRDLMEGVKLSNDDNESQYHKIAHSNQAAMDEVNRGIFRLSDDSQARELFSMFYQDYANSGGTFLNEDTAKVAAYAATLKAIGQEGEFFSVLEKSGLYSPNASATSKELENGPKDQTGVDFDASQEHEKKLPQEGPKNNVLNKDELDSLIEQNKAKVLEHFNQSQSDRGQKLLADLESKMEAKRQEFTNKDVFDGNSAHALKEVLSVLNGNLSDENIEKAYEQLKSSLGLDDIPNPVRDVENAYLNSQAGQTHLALSGKNTYSVVDAEEHKDKVSSIFDDKVAYENNMIAQLEKHASDPYLSEENQQFYKEQISERKDNIIKLEEQRENFIQGLPYNTSVDKSGSVSDQHKQQLTQALLHAESVGEQFRSTVFDERISYLETMNTQLKEQLTDGYITNPETIQGTIEKIAKNELEIESLSNQSQNISSISEEHDKHIDFLKEQIENIDNGNDYRLENKEDAIRYTPVNTKEIPL